jgi:hypothetical protein
VRLHVHTHNSCSLRDASVISARVFCVVFHATNIHTHADFKQRIHFIGSLTNYFLGSSQERTDQNARKNKQVALIHNLALKIGMRSKCSSPKLQSEHRKLIFQKSLLHFKLSLYSWTTDAEINNGRRTQVEQAEPRQRGRTSRLACSGTLAQFDCSQAPARCSHTAMGQMATEAQLGTSWM